MINFVGFFICAAIIFFSGKKLSYYGDQLADLTGMGKAWIGIILMSAVTSLPELMVSIGSVTIVSSPDLVVGDILGSCAFNLCILSMMDFISPKEKNIFLQLSKSQVLSAAFGLLLIAMTGLGIFFESDIVLTPFIGFSSISLGFIYLVSIKTIYQYQKTNESNEHHELTNNGPLTLQKVILQYSIYAAIIILASLALPYFAEHISTISGLNQSFVGTLFLALSTSLPEIAISLAALKIGSVDMAIGNILGSNIFNIFILFVTDLFYLDGLLLKDASDSNLITVFFVIMMSAIAIIGIVFPGKKSKISMTFDAFFILILFLINMILLYKFV
jgi:cation:H+ antiporter